MRAPVTDLPVTFLQAGVVVGDVTILDNISLMLDAGPPTVLIGPNGAGKTTLLRAAIGLIPVSRGRITRCGHDETSTARRAIMFQRATMLRRSAAANIRYALAAAGVPSFERNDRIGELLTLVGLAGLGDRPARRLSGGEQQRLSLARALARDPEVLFLDEPSAGLDPQTRLLLWEIVRQYNDRGKTILMTTHNMEEADAMCQRIAIIDHGRLNAQGTPRDLKTSIPGGFLVRWRFSAAAPDFLARLEAIEGVREVRAGSEGVDLYADRGGSLIPEVVAAASAAGVEIHDVHISEPSLENLFLHHTGRSLRE